MEYSVKFYGIDMIPTFKQLLKSKAINADKKILSKIWYKINDSLLQAGKDNKKYRNILSRQNGMNYSPVIWFEKSPIKKTKKNNSQREIIQKNLNPKQKNWCWCGSINNLRITSKDLPVGLDMGKEKILALGMGLYQYEEIIQ